MVTLDGLKTAEVARELRLSEQRDGKWTKPPYNVATGTRASHSDPTTWAPFEAVWPAFLRDHYDGVGFVLTDSDPYTALDLDKCRNPETGHIAAWAQAIIDRF